MSLQDFQKLRRRLASIMAVAMVISNLQCPWPIISYAATGREMTATASDASGKEDIADATPSDAEGSGQDCICKDLCEEGHVNENCPVCKEDYSDCFFAQDGEIINDLATPADATPGDAIPLDGVLLQQPVMPMATGVTVTWTVTYHTGEGAFADEKKETVQTVTDGEYTQSMTEPVRSGYKFAGWCSDAALTDLISESTFLVTGNMEVYAKWSSAIKVTFDANEGSFYSGNKTEEREALPGESVWVSKPTRDGFTFAGWCRDKAGEELLGIGSLYPAESMTVYAKWVTAADMWTVTYHANGGTYWDGAVTQTLKVIKGQNIYGSIPTRDDKGFTGWYLDEDATDKLTDSGFVPEKDMDVYAGWADQWTITFDAAGGQFDGAVNTKVYKVAQGKTIGTTVESYLKDRSGITFAGWYKEDGTLIDWIYNYIPKGNETIYAGWNEYWTVTYMKTSSSYIEKVAKGDSLGNSYLSDRKTGYQFEGWYLDQTLTKPVDRYYVPTSDITLYPKFDRVYTIMLKTNEGSFYNGSKSYTTTVVQGAPLGSADISEPTNGTKMLEGWCKDEGLTSKVDDGYIPTSDETIYAKWMTGYTIICDAGKGVYSDGSHMKEYQIEQGAGVSYLTDPTLDQGAFQGWYLDQEFTQLVTRGYVPTSDVTLYAKWKVSDSWIVTLHAGGNYIYQNGSYDTSNLTIQVPKGTELNIPSTSRTGYTCEWYLEPDFVTPVRGNYYYPNADINLYAKWVREWTITFKANGGYFKNHRYYYITRTSRITDGYQINSFPDVTKEGYALDGWYDENGNKIEESYVPHNSMVLTARWTDGYKVTYDLDGGVQDPWFPDSIYVKSGSAIKELPVPSKAGYGFDGWYIGSSKLTESTPITAPATAKAKWTKGYKVTLKIVGNAAFYVHSADGYVDLDEVVCYVPQGKRLRDYYTYSYTSGFGTSGTFSGWSRNTDGSDLIEYDALTINKDETIYFVCDENHYRITIECFGGFYKGQQKDDGYLTSVKIGESMTLSTPTRENYTFDGWYTTASYDPATKLSSDTFTPTGNMSVFAKWIEGNVKKYTVTFNTDGGSEVASQQVVEYGAVMQPATSAKENATFTGWFTNPALTIRYNFASNVTSDMTLYAGWREDARVSIADAVVVLDKETYQYTGSAITPGIVSVTVGTTTLIEGTDYTVSVSDAVNVGTAKLTLTGVGAYKGICEKTFQIVDKDPYPIGIPMTQMAVYGQILENVMLYPMGWEWDNPEQSVGDVGSHSFAATYASLDENYADVHAAIEVVVSPASLREYSIGLKDTTKYVYTGSKIEPEVDVTKGTVTLIDGTDYTVSYENNINAGVATIKATGKGNYSGTITTEFNIGQGEDPLGSIEVFNNIKYIYGETLGSRTIPEGWTWQHPDTQVGDAGITHNYLADFHSTNPNYKDKTGISIRVQVEPKDLKNSMVEMDGSTKIYSGSSFTPEVTVTDVEKLVDGKDYEVTYSNNTNVGTATVSIEGMGNYTGTVVRSFSIIDDPYSIKNAKITLIPSTYVYDGNEKTPAATVELANKTLAVGTDYEISYKNYVNVGTATATITGKGEYHDAQDVNFAITKAKPEPPVPQGQTLRAVYGQKLSEIELKAGWTWQDAAQEVGDIGTYTFLADFVSSDSNYADQAGVELQVEVVQKSILDNDVTITVAKDNLVYDGNDIEPEITITYRDKTLVKDTDFTVTYSDNMNAGKAKVVVTGIGNYKGTTAGVTGDKDLSFDIGQAQAKVEVKTTEMEVTTKDEPFYLNATFKGDGDVTYTVEGEGVISVRKETADEQHKNDAEVTVLGKGEATIHIELKETTNYKGAKMDVHVTVVPVKIGSGDVRLTEKEFTYSGSAFTPEPIVKVNGADLTIGTDYTVAYNKNTDAGTAEVIVSGINDYTGSVTKTFTILKAEDTSEAAKTPTGLTATYGQTLESIALPERWTWVTPEQSVGAVGVQTAKADYEAADANHLGKEKVEVEITVSAKAITADMVTVDKDNLVYTGAEVKAPVTVQDGDQTLIPDTDYVASYSNAAEAGTASVKIEGMGNYAGEVEDTYQIAKADAQIQCTEEFTVKTKDEPFNLNARFTGDGEISYTSENPSVVTVDTNGLVTVQGHGRTYINLEMKEGKNYKGTALKVQVTVEQISITDAGVAVADEERIFNGSAYTPVPVVVLNQIQLTEGNDYTVSYEGNVHAGTAKVIVTGINNYKDTAETTFVIGRAEDTSAAASTPVDIHMVYGQKLADVVLPAGWSWADSTQVSGNVGTSQYEAVYTPADPDYAGKSAVVTVTIAAKEMTSDLFAFDTEGYTYTGNDVKPEVQLKDSAMTTDDFTIVYENCVEAGTATAVITGQQNYTGTVNVSYTILKVKPEITVKAGYFISKYTTDDAFVLEATASNAAPLTYTSSNEKVAEVDETGVVTLKGEGTAVILIKSEEQKNYVSAVKTVTVIVVKKEEPQKPGEPENPDDPQKPEDSQKSDGGDSDYITPGAGSAAGGANHKNYIPQGYVGATKVIEGNTVPSYVEKGTWTKSQNGTWSFTCEDGTQRKNQWAAVYNAAAGFEWYHFDTTGIMQTGLITDTDGSKYYLDPSSGKMMIGWVKIDGLYYYFSEVSDGKRGRRLEDTRTPDGYYVNPDGSWDGKEETEA